MLRTVLFSLSISFVFAQDTLIQTCDPLDLVIPQRYDVMAKYIFGSFRKMEVRSSWGEEVYREHIKVFNGFYELNPHKSSYADFYNGFLEVLDSVEADGLYGVLHISKDGIILNGSHRLAACLVHQQEVPYIQMYDTYGSDFSSEYFRNRGLDEKYLDTMAIAYCDLK